MNHKDYSHLFESIADFNQHIRNGEEHPEYPTGKRCSFFRMNNEMELINSKHTQINYPCLILGKAFGQLQGDGSAVEDSITATFDIRIQVDEKTNFDEIDDAYDLSKEIGFEVIATILAIQDERGCCEGIGDFDINTTRYDFIGPINDSQYGCRFVFNFKTEAFNPYEMDIDGLNF